MQRNRQMTSSIFFRPPDAHYGMRIEGKAVPLRPVWLIGSVLILSARLAAAAVKDGDCLDCHSDKTLSKKNSAGREVSLFVDKVQLAASVHQTNTCVSCHADVTTKH